MYSERSITIKKIKNKNKNNTLVYLKVVERVGL